MKYLINKKQLTSLDIQFIREMKRRDLWYKYCYNIKNQCNHSPYQQFKKYRHLLVHIREYIMYGFGWAKSNEGEQFWQGVYYELSKTTTNNAR